MNKNESHIINTTSNIKFYKDQLDKESNGVSRKLYMKQIKMLETNKQLAILKERNIKG